ncbi:MAG: hypothetical protein ABSA48_12405 [Terracidiphilus sp.]
MNLKGKSAAFYLSEEGKTLLGLIMDGRLCIFDLGGGQHGIVNADVEESEDLGVWLRLERNGPSKFFLLRWEFIVGIEVNDEKGKVIGLRG